MGTTSLNVNGASNLRPFVYGNRFGKGGNQRAALANRFITSLDEASTPERRAALAETLWAYALGKYEERICDKDGVPQTHPDGSWKTKVLPPQPWAMAMILDRCMGSLAFKSIDGTAIAEEGTDQDRVVQAVRQLLELGGPFAEAVPPRLRELATTNANGG